MKRPPKNGPHALIGVAALLLCILTPLPLFPQEEPQTSIDDLFGAIEEPEEPGEPEEPEETEKPEETEEPGLEVVDLDDLTTSPVTFSAAVSAGIGAGVGFQEWPGYDPQGRTAGELLRYSGFYNTSAVFTIDARPEPYLRFKGSLKTSFDEELMRFSDPEVDELFIDYTLADWLFFRAGKQRLTWGQGRLLGNPANLVSRVAEGIAFRSTLPAGPGTLNGVIYRESGEITGGYEPHNPRVFSYAGQWEATLGPAVIALSGHYKADDTVGEDIGAAASLSFGIGPLNLAADLTGQWGGAHFSWAPAEWDALAQLFWESEGRSWSLLSEYRFDSTTAGGMGHHAGVGLRMPQIGDSGWRPALRWKHAFEDHSGEVVAAIDGTIAPRLKLSVGVPLIYGASNSYYRVALGESEEEEYVIPIDNVLTLLLSVRLSFSF